MIRTFIGIEIDGETAAELGMEISYLKSHFPKIRWVKQENIHLTLKFLGALPPDDLREVFTAAEETAGSIPPFSLGIHSVGAFPNSRFPRVVWAGCTSGSDQACKLAKTLDENFEIIGYPPERKPYHPHLTLGRVKRPADARGIEEYIEDNKDTSFGIFDVDEIVVFMSELKKDGAIYSPMQRIKLGE